MKRKPDPGVPTSVRPKELRKLLRQVHDSEGWEVCGTNNHIKVTGPDGQKVFTSSSARSPRVVLEVRSDLRRAGWDG